MPARLNKSYFNKVKVARQLLRDQAEEILKQYMEVVQEARDAKDFETAAKMLQWLVEHMPADEDGERMVEKSIDKQQQVIETGPSGPAIQIGIQVGGAGGPKAIAIKKPKELPPVEAEVIK